MKKNVLFIDDDEDILFAYRFTVESDYTTVYTASNVDTALDIVKRSRSDVAVLDYLMPGVRGDELAQQIYLIDPGVKIYFISGYDIALEAVKKLDISVYGVFMKPVNPDVLIRLAETDVDSSSLYPLLCEYPGNLYTNIYPDNSVVSGDALNIYPRK